MSGQLVGEVLAASSSIKAAGLPPRAFHGLIAIAEKAGTDTRQGSVPWSHIRAALYGASLRTAERAVEDLRKAGLVRVVRSGFNNNNGRACAPVYEVASLGDAATQVSVSLGNDPATQVSGSEGDRSRQSGDRSRQNRDRSRHSGVGLNGSTNGSTNEGSAREAGPAPPGPFDYPDDPPEDQPFPFGDAAPASAGPPNPHPGPEPPTRCRGHINWVGRVPDCGACRDLRAAHDGWAHDYERWRGGEKQAIQDEIKACGGCGPTGWTEPDDPDEPTRRCRRHRQMANLAAPIVTSHQEARR
ncbi:hypothetical protein [Mycobacterium sp. NPDC050041]|uniref:hypothetical protein n=1 Tax=Mycobacterium sp. NPDC050041 TaxID=3364293 RepID=UPI003C30DAA2